MDDDEHLAFAVLAVCDAIQTDLCGARCEAAVENARKHAHAVLNRGKPKTETTPAQEPEGENQ